MWDAPWGGFQPPDVSRADIDALVDRIDADTALILTSFHQSPLPTALVLRLAGVRHIAADSVDYPGSLLDLRHQRAPHAHEAEAALDLAEAAGFPRPDDGRLRVRTPPRADALTGPGPYVVLHPGASVPARAWSRERAAEAVRELAAAGHRVLVTGGPDERDLTAYVAGGHGTDLGGRTEAPELSGVLAGAAVVVTGNTAPAHLAAAVGTPVVSLFAPVVPAERWRPYGVPYVLLGDQDAPLRGQPGPGLPRPRPSLPEHRHGHRRGGRRRETPGGGMRILIWHVHGSWTTAFVQGPHTYLVPVTPDRGPDGLGRAHTWDWPDSVVEVPPERLRDEHIDLVIIQRPHELALVDEWLGRRPPLVYLEHNAPDGNVPDTRHPAADLPDVTTLVHVTHFNRLDVGRGSEGDDGRRTRHRRPGPPLDR